jgi:hypothetical protein
MWLSYTLTAEATFAAFSVKSDNEVGGTRKEALNTAHGCTV